MDRLKKPVFHVSVGAYKHRMLNTMWDKINEIVDWINKHDKQNPALFTTEPAPTLFVPTEVDSVGAPSIDLIIRKSEELTHLLKERKRIRSAAKKELCKYCGASLQWIELSPHVKLWDCPNCYYEGAPRPPRRDPNGPPFYE